MSFEGDVCKQAGFPVNFGGLGCRRAEDIALPSSLSSMNSVGELVETILSRINTADTNELAEVVESWRGASGGATLPDDPSRQKAWDLPIVERNWENMLRFHFWTPRVLGLPLPLEHGLSCKYSAGN